jgi:hypothetical protein
MAITCWMLKASHFPGAGLSPGPYIPFIAFPPKVLYQKTARPAMAFFHFISWHTAACGI